ncbi:MAG TPA: aminotransferase class I/II-fold pyridoxal phosphate-dependent enzyme [Clostridiales bacterium]|nr:aminotransferase class I/II-fold pyridoxal phosphate-dependent enzyme [Clostridiales bacterium]
MEGPGPCRHFSGDLCSEGNAHSYGHGHKHGGDIYQREALIDFSANINLLGIPEGVAEAACKGVRLSASYPDVECRELRKEIARSAKVPMEQVICGNGAADIIYSLVLALKPKKALLPVPSFYEYEKALRVVDCGLEYFLLREEDDFLLREDFLDAIREDIDIIFLCNPNNPTGSLTEKKLMERIIQKCEELSIWLLVDECFLDFVEEGRSYSVLEQIGEAKHLMLLKAFTKLYAMPGLRLGYGICSNREFLLRMKEAAQPWNVSIPAQLAGVAALKETGYVTASLELVKQERAYLSGELMKLGFQIYCPKANYIFFRGTPGLASFCLERGILIRDCSNYRGLEEGYYRIAVKKHEENVQLVKILGEAVSLWQKRL